MSSRSLSRRGPWSRPSSTRCTTASTTAPVRRRSSRGRATRRASLGHEGGLVERDAMVFQAAKRIAALDAAHEGLVFGRLDLIDGDARYIGRIGLRDADREVLLVDWRAPAAERVLPGHRPGPAGVVRRRVLRCRGRTVTGVEDELLDADAAPEGMAVVGDGALLASLGGPATLHALGRRHDPEGAGRGDPRAQPRRDDDRRRARHRQDRRRAAPCRLPALHRAPPVRVRRRAGRRAVGCVHELHRAGAAEPRRDQRDAAPARRGRRRHRRHPARRRRWPPGQGLEPDAPGAGPGCAATWPGGARRVPRLLARRGAAARRA